MQESAKYLSKNYMHEWVGLGPAITKENWIHVIPTFWNAFPDYTATITNIVVKDDLVVIEVRGIGTHKKEWLGIPPTSKSIEWKIVFFMETRDGFINKTKEYFDNSAFFKQTQVISKSFF